MDKEKEFPSRIHTQVWPTPASESVSPSTEKQGQPTYLEGSV